MQATRDIYEFDAPTMVRHIQNQFRRKLLDVEAKYADIEFDIETFQINIEARPVQDFDWMIEELRVLFYEITCLTQEIQQTETGAQVLSEDLENLSNMEAELAKVIIHFAQMKLAKS